MSSRFRSSRVFFSARLPKLATLGLLAIFCWMLANWTWLVMAPSVPVVVPDAQSVIDAHAARETIVRSRLFASSASPEQRQASTPTTLDLKLVGVMASKSGRGPSLAVLNLHKKANQVFAEGGEIAPGVILARIVKDHVLIRRQGTLERVDFPESARVPGTSSAFNLSVLQHGASQFSFSRNSLNRALQDPAQLSQLGSLTVVPGAGAAIDQVPAGSLLQKLGLQVGDMIKLVNGEQLDSQDDLPRLYQKFATTGQVTLEGSRAGAPLKLSYTVKP